MIPNMKLSGNTAGAAAGFQSQGVERVVRTGDLIDENFLHPRSYMSDEIKLSGWETDASGGYFEYAEEEWFRIVDNSNTASVNMKKRFVSQKEGKITLEYRFMMPEKMEGVEWKLCSGNVAGVSIVTAEGKLCVNIGANSYAVGNLSSRFGIRCQSCCRYFRRSSRSLHERTVERFRDSI
jgi:hypothetical protein